MRQLFYTRRNGTCPEQIGWFGGVEHRPAADNYRSVTFRRFVCFCIVTYAVHKKSTAMTVNNRSGKKAILQYVSRQNARTVVWKKRGHKLLNSFIVFHFKIGILIKRSLCASNDISTMRKHKRRLLLWLIS